jgi:hypothetical protein
MATRTKEEFKVDSLNALADKGYHNAEELHKCRQDNITTYVGVPQYGNTTSIPASGYHAEDFTYDRQADCYICPQEVKLLTNGKFYKKPCRNENFTLVKQYHTKMCKGCRVKHLCTIARKGRVIERSQYQDAALGYHKDKCDNPLCGFIHVSYNSCRDRHCPKCNGIKREKWVCMREEDLLPV